MSRSALFRRSSTSSMDGRRSSTTTLSGSSRQTRGGAPAAWNEAPAYDGRTDSQWIEVARAMAEMHGVPEDLFLRLVRQDRMACGRCVAQGRNRPGTAHARHGSTPRRQSSRSGAESRRWRPLSAHAIRPVRDLDLALAAYNAGPEAVAQYGGVPPYAETQGYVRAIWGG
jgi:soluble lytic murein transglycosylase-like protein